MEVHSSSSFVVCWGMMLCKIAPQVMGFVVVVRGRAPNRTSYILLFYDVVCMFRVGYRAILCCQSAWEWQVVGDPFPTGCSEC
jgi:uncharacterized membrane protein